MGPGAEDAAQDGAGHHRPASSQATVQVATLCQRRLVSFRGIYCADYYDEEGGGRVLKNEGAGQRNENAEGNKGKIAKKTRLNSHIFVF